MGTYLKPEEISQNQDYGFSNLGFRLLINDTKSYFILYLFKVIQVFFLLPLNHIRTEMLIN